MIRDLKSGDVISFTTTNHQLLGDPRLVTVVAKCNYDVAVQLDQSLPNVINSVVMDSGIIPYDPHTREYLVYQGVNGVRAIDTLWVVESTITYPSTITTRITLHNVTISDKDLAIVALNNLGLNYTVD